jgi:hypothetical protein
MVGKVRRNVLVRILMLIKTIIKRGSAAAWQVFNTLYG